MYNATYTYKKSEQGDLWRTVQAIESYGGTVTSFDGAQIEVAWSHTAGKAAFEREFAGRPAKAQRAQPAGQLSSTGNFNIMR